MRESDYIRAANVTAARVALAAVRIMSPSRLVSESEISELERLLARIIERNESS